MTTFSIAISASTSLSIKVVVQYATFSDLSPFFFSFLFLRKLIHAGVVRISFEHSLLSSIPLKPNRTRSHPFVFQSRFKSLHVFLGVVPSNQLQTPCNFSLEIDQTQFVLFFFFSNKYTAYRISFKFISHFLRFFSFREFLTDLTINQRI